MSVKKWGLAPLALIMEGSTLKACHDIYIYIYGCHNNGKFDVTIYMVTAYVHSIQRVLKLAGYIFIKVKAQSFVRYLTTRKIL